MRQTKNNMKDKKKLTLLLLVLLVLGLGLGYAVLSEQLKLNGSVNYGAMNWEVGFTTPTDGGGSVTSTSSVSSDKKSVTIACNLGTSTKSETCIAKVKIDNGSTFAVELEEAPAVEFDNTYIESVTTTWSENSSAVAVGDTVGSEASKEVIIKITTKALSKDMLPADSLTVPVTVTMDWVENK